jgi:CHAD domain-containing protein
VYRQADDGHFRIVREAACVDGCPGAVVESGWKAGAGSSQPEFGARIMRTLRTVRCTDGTEILVAIDRGRAWLADARRRYRPVLELELALIQGRRERLYELASAIVDEAPSMQLLFGNDADRAYRALTGPRTAQGTPSRCPVDIASSPARLVYRATSECVEHMAYNAADVRMGADGESLHQLRVGVRRFRTVSAIGPEAGLPALPASVRADFKWLWALLGEARDWDVFTTETWPAVRRFAKRTDARRFEEATAQLLAAKHAAVRRALNGKRFQLAMLAVQRFNIQQREEAERASPPRGAKRLARRLLANRAGKFGRRGKGIARLSIEGLHELRIQAKRLRYLGECFACIYRRDASRRYLKRLAAVQTALGRLNDLAVSERIVVQVDKRLRALQRPAARELCRRYVALAEPRLRNRLTKELKQFRNTPPFWQ